MHWCPAAERGRPGRPRERLYRPLPPINPLARIADWSGASAWRSSLSGNGFCAKKRAFTSPPATGAGVSVWA